MHQENSVIQTAVNLSCHKNCIPKTKLNIGKRAFSVVVPKSGINSLPRIFFLKLSYLHMQCNRNKIKTYHVFV